MIHRDDLVEVIIAALKNGRAGEIYNVADDEPVSLMTFYRWLAETLGKWMPPFVPEEEAPERKRALTSKKVQNRKMKTELGVQLKYPTFRQGYTAEIQRLDQAGQLNIDPDPR
jgi:nucleoside-diphosphate-sugar epimerase